MTPLSWAPIHGCVSCREALRRAGARSGIRRAATVALVLLTNLQLHGQGAVFFGNAGPTAVSNCLTGARVVAGTTFLVALYYAPDQVFDESRFVAVGAPIGFTAPGIFFGGTATAPVEPAGDFAMFQIRVWESSFGLSYEAAVNSPPDPFLGRSALRGQSEILRLDTADPSAIPPVPPSSPTIFSPIMLTAPDAPCVPEPKVTVFLGVGAFLLGLSRFTKERRGSLDRRRRRGHDRV